MEIFFGIKADTMLGKDPFADSFDESHRAMFAFIKNIPWLILSTSLPWPWRNLPSRTHGIFRSALLHYSSHGKTFFRNTKVLEDQCVRIINQKRAQKHNIAASGICSQTLCGQRMTRAFRTPTRNTSHFLLTSCEHL